ncbi:uncharacterized protein LOC116426675 [Nomia melanderi]|uniref:uncharacterized protein LOC116426675 n=1 Tax=Nomia melanderi TaxID=2448451 RepID=UPI0013046BC6|nr:uncharacterized protein LOC116426675 [Nomia melanderi]
MHRSSIVSAGVPLFLFIAGFSVALSAVALDREAYRESPNLPPADSPDDNAGRYIPEDWQRNWRQSLTSEIKIHSAERNASDLDINWLFAVIFRHAPQNYKAMESLDQNTSGNKIEEIAEDVGVNEIGKSDETVIQTDNKFVIPQLESRTIVDPPEFQCPEGEKKDPAGKCRPIIT